MMGATSVGYKSSAVQRALLQPGTRPIRRRRRYDGTPVPAAARSARPPTPASAASTRFPTCGVTEPEYAIRRLRRDHARGPVARSRTRRRPPTTTSTPAPRASSRQASPRASLHGSRHRSDRRDAPAAARGRRSTSPRSPPPTRRTSRSGTRTTGPASASSRARPAWPSRRSTTPSGSASSRAAEELGGRAGINPLRFLPIGDFNSARRQKNLWFSKLFSQIPAGASPRAKAWPGSAATTAARKTASTPDMPATGANDPIQYACQQNFTIMTTDGYWNGQTESSAAGLSGGGLQLDGTTKVGQQDGDPPARSATRSAAADLGRHLRLDPRRHQQDQRLHRQRLQPGRHVPLERSRRSAKSRARPRTRRGRRSARSSTSKRRARSSRRRRRPRSPAPTTSSTTEQFVMRREYYDRGAATSTSSREEQTTKVTEQ